MATLEHRINIDTILSYILIKKLVAPIVRSDAYKLGLVNNAGKLNCGVCIPFLLTYATTIMILSAASQ